MDGIAPDPGPASSDERREPRFEGRVGCHLVVGGARWRCWLRDLSLGGAGVEPAMPALLDQTVVLTSPAFAFDPPLTGRVVNVAHRRTCVAFELGAEAEAALARFLDDNT
ncbi:MAG TPA: PilZ domain-containing protein [Geminicoccaceae bacterium]